MKHIQTNKFKRWLIVFFHAIYWNRLKVFVENSLIGGPGNLGIAPGSLPPGARFDPFRPPDLLPGPRGPRRPDNDEFPPPGYDDMYM